MNKETKSILKKTIKVTGVTCIALGGAALIASGAALKAMTEGAKYLKNTIEKIVNDEPDAAEPAAQAAEEEPKEAPAAEPVAEEAPAAEPVAEEADFAEEEPQEV